jgi:hypothetical protein
MLDLIQPSAYEAKLLHARYSQRRFGKKPAILG